MHTAIGEPCEHTQAQTPDTETLGCWNCTRANMHLEAVQRIIFFVIGCHFAVFS